MRNRSSEHRHSGFSLIEVLVALLVTAIGLLGMVALQGRAQQAQVETLQRAQAMLLINDIVDRMSANRTERQCFGFTTNNGNGTPFLGTGATAVPACPSGTPAAVRALADMASWNAALQGTGETLNDGADTPVGGLIGARGCIRRVPPAAAGAPDRYQVMVSWQGQYDTLDPGTQLDDATTVEDENLHCADGLYGNAAQRRTVGIWVEFADLG